MIKVWIADAVHGRKAIRVIKIVFVDVTQRVLLIKLSLLPTLVGQVEVGRELEHL